MRLETVLGLRFGGIRSSAIYTGPADTSRRILISPIDLKAHTSRSYRIPLLHLGGEFRAADGRETDDAAAFPTKISTRIGTKIGKHGDEIQGDGISSPV